MASPIRLRSASLKLTAKLKSAFFDRPEVARRIGAARKRNLSRMGAFVRQRARTDVLRRNREVSEPGDPPHIHQRFEPNLRTVYFAYDSDTESCVVGPLRFNALGPSVPGILEHGGAVQVQEVRDSKSGTWRRLFFARERQRQKTRRRTYTYQARPFMSEALRREKESPKFLKIWEDSI